MNTYQIAAEAADKIRNGTNMRRDGRAEAIIKAAIEKAHEDGYVQGARAGVLNERELRAAHASEQGGMNPNQLAAGLVQKICAVCGTEWKSRNDLLALAQSAIEKAHTLWRNGWQKCDKCGCEWFTAAHASEAIGQEVIEIDKEGKVSGPIYELNPHFKPAREQTKHPTPATDDTKREWPWIRPVESQQSDDTKRLDWCIAHPDDAIYLLGLCRRDERDFREAIDAAMRKE